MASRKKPVYIRPMRDQGITLTSNEEAVLYFRQRPVLAAKYLLDINLSWFQRKTIRNIWRVPYSLTVWGRGAGKTFTLGTAATLMGMLYPNMKIGVFGPVKRQGDYIFNEIEKLWNSSVFFRASTRSNVKRTMERNAVEFINGSFVDSMPVGDGSKIRGARYNVLFLDEYAQFDEEIMNLVILPFLAVTVGNRPNKLILSSSAFYKWNHLWERYKLYKLQEIKEPKLYYVSEYDFRDIMRDKDSPFKFDLNIIKHEKEIMTKATFEMEWLRTFPDDADTFYPSKLLEDCTPKPPSEVPIDIELNSKTRLQGDKYIDNGSLYTMGVDVGRVEGGANFAICLIKLTGDEKNIIRILSRNGVRYQEMQSLIRRCTIDYNITRIHIDKGGGGDTIKDLLSEPWVDPETAIQYDPILDMEDEETENVIGLRYMKLVNFQGTKHATLFANLKAEMEHRRVLFPIHLRRHEDKEFERANQEIKLLKTELAVLKPKPVGASLRFEVPSGFRKDRAVALTLALDAALDMREHSWKEKVEDPLPVGFWLDT